MEIFTFKWFVLGYFILSGLLTVQGLVLMFSPVLYVKKFEKNKVSEKAPSSLIRLIKYLFLFGLLSFSFSFFPFKIQHFFYSIWILTMVFVVGKTLVNWQGFCQYWVEHSDKLNLFFQKLGAFCLIIGLVTFVILLYTI